MGNPFKYSYKTALHIEAKKEKIWNILTNLDSYPEWNPFTTKVETNWNIGDQVKLTVQMNAGKIPIIQKETLSRFNPMDEISWGMNWGFFLKAERVQRLSTAEHGNTLYFTEDTIKGLLSPIVHALYGRSIQDGFDALAQSLKNFVENP